MSNSACVVRNPFGIYEVSMELIGDIPKNITETVSKVLECNMAVCEKERNIDSSLLRFTEAECYSAEVAVLSIDKDGQQVVGDSSAYFKTEDGKLNCILSDGMGSGERAANESGKVVRLFKSLTNAGFKPDEAIKLINTAFILNGGREACTSADILTINLRSGYVEIYKAGAAATIVKSEKSAEAIRCSSFPLGILDIVEVEMRHFYIETPAYIIMMTDGVPDSKGDRIEGEEHVKELIANAEDMPINQIAQMIINDALAGGSPKDDMTVLVVKVCKKDM
jgi:stage II sporulation protein E